MAQSISPQASLTMGMSYDCVEDGDCPGGAPSAGENRRAPDKHGHSGHNLCFELAGLQPVEKHASGHPSTCKAYKRSSYAAH